MGRTSSLRRKEETAIDDRLILWKINRTRKDGSWSSADARDRWAAVCAYLGERGLTPEDGNKEENERALLAVMGPEHPGRVRTQGFGVTPTKYFASSSRGVGRGGSSGASTSRDHSYDELSQRVEDQQAQIQAMQALIADLSREVRNRRPGTSGSAQDDYSPYSDRTPPRD